MKIVLLRHGKPKVEFAGQVKACELHSWITAYNLSGINGKPPLKSIEMAQNCNAIICSDLPRSIQSATALGIDKILMIDSLFSEAGLPYPQWNSPRLPIKVWAILFRIFWFLGYSSNAESLRSAKQRARLAANKLIKMATEYESVLLVGHGFINRFIANALISSGWQGAVYSGNKYWAFEVYQNFKIDTTGIAFKNG